MRILAAFLLLLAVASAQQPFQQGWANQQPIVGAQNWGAQQWGQQGIQQPVTGAEWQQHVQPIVSSSALPYGAQLPEQQPVMSNIEQQMPIQQQQQMGFGGMPAKWSGAPVTAPVQQFPSNQLPLASGKKQAPVLSFGGVTRNQPISQQPIYENLPTQVMNLQGTPSQPIQAPVTANQPIWRQAIRQANKPLVQQAVSHGKNQQFMQQAFPQAVYSGATPATHAALLAGMPQQQFNMPQQQFPAEQQQFPEQPSGPMPQELPSGPSGPSAEQMPKSLGAQQMRFTPAQANPAALMSGNINQMY